MPSTRTSFESMTGTLYITGDEVADALLNTDANALLIGMLLDQQVSMEWAFAGPATLQQRLGHLDPAQIAAMDEDDFVSICCEKPAIHRFPGSMGKRIHQACTALVTDYDGSAENLWVDVESVTGTRSRRSSSPFSARPRVLSSTVGAMPPASSAMISLARLPTSMMTSRSARSEHGRRLRKPPKRTSRTGRSADQVQPDFSVAWSRSRLRLTSLRVTTPESKRVLDLEQSQAMRSA